jgi:hypothetical protein
MPRFVSNRARSHAYFAAGYSLAALLSAATACGFAYSGCNVDKPSATNALITPIKREPANNKATKTYTGLMDGVAQAHSTVVKGMEQARSNVQGQAQNTDGYLVTGAVIAGFLTICFAAPAYWRGEQAYQTENEKRERNASEERYQQRMKERALTAVIEQYEPDKLAR